jgi:hypothetical protein
MVVPRLHVRDDGALGPQVKRASLICAHGTTSRLLLPGRATLREDVLRDLLIVVHDVEKGCGCGEALRQPAYDA